MVALVKFLTSPVFYVPGGAGGVTVESVRALVRGYFAGSLAWVPASTGAEYASASAAWSIVRPPGFTRKGHLAWRPKLILRRAIVSGSTRRTTRATTPSWSLSARPSSTTATRCCGTRRLSSC